MNSTIRALAILALATLTVAPPSAQAEPRRFIVGASPSLPKAERDAAWSAVLEFIAMQMRQGDGLALYDAVALQPVAELKIPVEPLFASAKPRLIRLAPELARLKAFFQAPAGTPSPFDGTLLAPQFLDFAARHLRHANEPMTVVLVGVPFYRDPEGAFDFGPDGSYPGDGFLSLPAGEAPFSTTGKANVLEGVAVHWAFLSEARWSNDTHRNGVLRFWNLFIRTQAGVLASAAADAKTVLQRAADGVSASVGEASPDPDAKAEMIMPRHPRVGPAEVARPTSSADDVREIQQRAPDWLKDAVVPTAKTPAPPRGSVKIGLRWGDNDPLARAIDLDAYVQPRPGAKEICYFRARTPEGWLWKDWLESPAVANGFEVIELNGETDLSQLRLAVNFYRGHHPSGSVAAIVRLWVNGSIYETAIRIPSREGNRGAAFAQRQHDPHWVIVDVSKVLGLFCSRS